jgi:hypothetical protein
VAGWLTQDSDELKRKVEHAAKVARLPLGKLMKKAGLSAQSLAYWRKGLRVPEPESIERFGNSLIVQSDTLRALGQQLLEMVQEEETRRRDVDAAPSENSNLNLFPSRPSTTSA